MNTEMKEKLSRFLEVLGLEEEPMGIFYTDQKPEDALMPKQGDLPTREKEIRNEIDWQTVFGQFSCAMGHIWRARQKKMAACFDAGHFGCPGAAFWLGFMKPQSETIIHYVSSGIPDHMEGEFYCESPDKLRETFEQIDPRPAPQKYCIVKPITLFTPDETPELITFFTRPEPLGGLHQLAFFVTDDQEVVASPWGPGCGNIITWSLKYLEKGENRAVLGGWDPSARKFFKTDELSFTVPYAMFQQMLEKFESAFLKTDTWKKIQKRITRSRERWEST